MKRVKRFLFQRLHNNNLIYNACWEDPKCDRELMKLNQESRVAMITSGGCNALEYLLDDVKSIDCIDLNYRQNALLALKIAFFKHGDYDLLFAFFGAGKHPNARSEYIQKIRPLLNSEFQPYWDNKIRYFNGRGWRPSFYFKGTSGLLAWAFKKHMFLRPVLRKQVHQVLHALDFTEQRRAYDRAKSKLFSPLARKVFDHPLTLSLAGVPQAQADLYLQEFRQSPEPYLSTSFDKVFYHLPVTDNYFYSVYWNGHYEKDRCPAYLKKENFETIRARVDRVHWHTTSLTNFFMNGNRKFSHFVLLDHMDWLAKDNMKALEDEWFAIHKAKANEAHVLFRSASKDIDWLPLDIQQSVDFDRNRCKEVHQKDRVGMYASVWYGKLKDL